MRVCVSYLTHRCRKLRTELEELRAAERRGRAEAEKKLRKTFQDTRANDEVAKGEAVSFGSSESDESYGVRPIGYIRTCFSRRSGARGQFTHSKPQTLALSVRRTGSWILKKGIILIHEKKNNNNSNSTPLLVVVDFRLCLCLIMEG